MNPELPEDPSRPAGGETNAPKTPLHPESAPEGLDYEVLRLIGRGGYGEVWLVRDKAGAYFACKIIHRESFDHDRPYEREYDGIKKFEPVSRMDESQVKILHVGRRDQSGYFYYIMELADDAMRGREIDPKDYAPKTLRSELTRQGRLPLNECLQIGLSLSAAVEHLHSNGLIHRDIKPGNVIFVNGLPKLADIGLVTDADLSISYVGTEGYIPPEGPTSAQADVYGLGKVLYEIGTGKDRLDFPDLPTELAEMSDRQARLEFNSVVARACEAEPAKRYQTARELHADLALLQSGGSVRRRRAHAKRWLWIARVAAALVFVVLAAGGILYARRAMTRTPTASDAPVVRIPMPDAAQVVRFESEIRDKLKPQLADARPDVKAQIAEQLIRDSATAFDPARELASLRVANSLAKEDEDYEIAMTACDKISERFQLDIFPVKTELLKAGLPARTISGAGSLARAAIATGFDALGEDQFGYATPLADLAKSAATNSGNLHLVKQADFLTETVARCGVAFAQVSKSKDVLRQKPGDPAANLAMGQYLCFVKNDWENGLPMLAHGNDEQLKPVLEIEINKKPVRAPDYIAAGDLWWNLAAMTPGQFKDAFQRRARYWYRKGISRAQKNEKPALKVKLADRLNAFPAVPAELHLFCRLSGTDHIQISSDETRWSCGRGSQNCRLNQIYAGEMKSSSDRVFKNSGATLLLPDDVDFSTAHLEIDQMPRQKARANLDSSAMDHVRLNLVHSARGMAPFDVTIIFSGTGTN